MKIQEIAEDLSKLSFEGLFRYIREEERMVSNEVSMNRNPRKHIKYLRAAYLAIDMKEGEILCNTK
jgi:hypothetical protein